VANEEKAHPRSKKAHSISELMHFKPPMYKKHTQGTPNPGTLISHFSYFMQGELPGGIKISARLSSRGV
jgi:hypothetical protein